MRIPKYLSPSAIALWKKNRTEYYIKYLADEKAPRMAQTEPMSVGSGFDAFVKNYLVDRLTGGDLNGEYELGGLLMDQIEEHNLDFGIEAGEACFEAYKRQGALADLMREITGSVCGGVTPRFEFTVEGVVPMGPREVSAVEAPVDPEASEWPIFLGKPDCFWFACDDSGSAPLPVIIDWKVNGYCSKHGASPRKRYQKIRADGLKSAVHREYMGTTKYGVEYNMYGCFSEVDASWAAQLAIYGWLMGVPVGTPIVAGIEQLACKPKNGEVQVRSVSHRGLIREAFQLELYTVACDIWKATRTGDPTDVFMDIMGRAEAKETVKKLDDYHKGFDKDAEKGTKEDWFNGVMRQHRF
jgi:hypothetical protein